MVFFWDGLGARVLPNAGNMGDYYRLPEMDLDGEFNMEIIGN